MTTNEQDTAANRSYKRKQAKAQGITVPRGATAQQIEDLISARFREDYEAISNVNVCRRTR